MEVMVQCWIVRRARSKKDSFSEANIIDDLYSTDYSTCDATEPTDKLMLEFTSTS